MPRRFKILSRCEGASAVEFALVLPLLLLILGGTIDFGWLFYWQHTVTNASRLGARYSVQAKYVLGVSTPHTAAETITLVKNNYGADLEVTVDSTAGNNPGATRSVTVTKTMTYLWGVVLFPSTLQSKTTMTME